jgi:hypothetical protein
MRVTAVSLLSASGRCEAVAVWFTIELILTTPEMRKEEETPS